MSYMSEWICSEEELREAVKEDRDRIREEIKQAIENGVIKIETGSEKLEEAHRVHDLSVGGSIPSSTINFKKGRL